MPELEDEKKPRVYLEECKIKEDPNDYGFADEIFTIEKFKKSLKINLVSYKDQELEFDMIGVSPAIANAFRRLMALNILKTKSKYLQLKPVPNFLGLNV